MVDVDATRNPPSPTHVEVRSKCVRFPRHRPSFDIQSQDSVSYDGVPQRRGGRPAQIGAWIDGSFPTRAETVGGYVQGKANLGVVTISPFAGYRQLFGEVETSSSRFGYHTEDIDTGALFGGLETSVKFIPTGLELGARIEYGASTDDAADGGAAGTAAGS